MDFSALLGPGKTMIYETKGGSLGYFPIHEFFVDSRPPKINVPHEEERIPCFSLSLSLYDYGSPMYITM